YSNTRLTTKAPLNERGFLYALIKSVFFVFFGHFPRMPNIVDIVKMLTHLRAFGPSVPHS
ncbi:MAG: hypothetical protein IKU42_05075, partial [Oscillospiraceae bacterium]|nr:hypothetical protein [Oscillospiraceae bacterium]